MNETATKPTALLVMEEARRDDVYPPEVLAGLDRLVDWQGPPLTRQRLDEDPSVLREVDVLLTGWGAPVLDAALLGQAPRLRAVLVAAGSVRHITTPAFWERGIPIVSAAAANAVPVAEFTLAHVLLGLKQVHRVARDVAGSRRFPHNVAVPGAYRSRVGLLGLGHIGRLVAAHLGRFDVDVFATDPLASPESARQAGVTLLGVEELFATCHVVSLHAPLLPETRGTVGARLLNSLMPGATLINTARGALVDEDAAAQVLRARPDLTAVLDVTHPEPPAHDSPLFDLPNVVLTPHLGGAMGAERTRLGLLVLDELRRFTQGLPLQHAVDPTRAASLA
ncbi:glycerate dehydrogenase [Streptomyces spiroverticillatus]|uniref:Glycerate dehydrogenase n=1 Tax=Streptomyces finlayi TaxID=67296 RepID=A0A918X9E2_9ACTN|nr:hydroxyacid dehydrogenase [Streptomyces finlayi]GHA47446.1 glycerate dehydrogenase [Streptomyces spiroverticillatus]GHD18493.1 glycerate dehydrogenase [Streptomyces finlayi]